MATLHAETLPACTIIVQLLSKGKILSAPILDEDGEYLGAVSVPDVLRGLVRSE